MHKNGMSGESGNRNVLTKVIRHLLHEICRDISIKPRLLAQSSIIRELVKMPGYHKLNGHSVTFLGTALCNPLVI